ncbi:MAG: VOC family protein [Gemmatirosa sp.]|nr:VOC family protein [Gemmatirosa sp.]
MRAHSLRRRVALAAVAAGLTCLSALRVALGSPLAAHDAVGPEAVEVNAVPAVGMTVSDMERSIAFYTQVLAFRKLSDVEVAGTGFEHLEGVFAARARVVRLALGDERLELTEYLTPRGRPVPVDSRSEDRWFQHVAIIVRDMDSAYAVLRRHRVEYASSEPQRLPDWNPNAGGIRAFYFKDPDHHTLEILWFPAGKGLAKWHAPNASLFLGIDHTAIVAGSTDASVAFYRDLLGMRVAGESENYGPEQERLNAVFGAHLRITALRAATGPGVELLEYLAPRDGRPYPTDARPNDLLHWETTVAVPDVERAAHALRAAATPFVSTGAVALPDTLLGFQRALLVRDPDGHAVRVVERR